jgi:hypothetical protein
MIEASVMTGILDLLDEIKKCEEADATLATIALCYMCIDAMAYVAMPADQAKNGGKDFREWVNRYLKADPQQPYQYAGQDIWGARCSYLHTFSPSSDFHEKHDGIVKLSYHDGTDHFFNESIDPYLAIIGLKSFSDDITKAVMTFLTEANADSAQKLVVAKRLETFFACYAVQ